MIFVCSCYERLRQNAGAESTHPLSISACASRAGMRGERWWGEVGRGRTKLSFLSPEAVPDTSARSSRGSGEHPCRQNRRSHGGGEHPGRTKRWSRRGDEHPAAANRRLREGSGHPKRAKRRSRAGSGHPGRANRRSLDGSGRPGKANRRSCAGGRHRVPAENEPIAAHWAVPLSVDLSCLTIDTSLDRCVMIADPWPHDS